MEGINGVLTTCLSITATLVKAWSALRDLELVRLVEYNKACAQLPKDPPPTKLMCALLRAVKSAPLWPYSRKKLEAEYKESDNYFCVPFPDYPRPLPADCPSPAVPDPDLPASLKVWELGVDRQGLGRSSFDQLVPRNQPHLAEEGTPPAPSAGDGHVQEGAPLTDTSRWPGRVVRVVGYYAPDGLTVVVLEATCSCCFVVTVGLACAHVLRALKHINGGNLADAHCSQFWQIKLVSPLDTARMAAEATLARDGTAPPPATVSGPL